RLASSLVALRLATASARLFGAASAASAVSELGAVATPRGAMSSGTVATTLARPIGTIDSEWSSWLAVTANSPVSGSGARYLAASRAAAGEATGAAGAGLGAIAGLGVPAGLGAAAACLAAACEVAGGEA